jgi:glycosyltransferase involved in cell wall biosynthesis
VRVTLRRRQGVTVVNPPLSPGVPQAQRSDGVLRFGIVGRIARWKGQDVFLRAFAAAFPDGATTAAIIGAPLFTGDDRAFEQDLRGLAEELGFAGRVEFRGFRDDIRAELARLDVAVHASRTAEPWGQTVAEAMAAGLPVVATDEGGPAELIHDGIDGLLVPRGDPQALSAALRRLHDAPDLRRRLAVAAPRAIEHLKPEEAARRLARIYAEMTSKRNGSAVPAADGYC